MRKAVFAPTHEVVYQEYDMVTFVYSPNYVINPLVYIYIGSWSALEHTARDVGSVIDPDLAELEAGMEVIDHKIFVWEMVCMNKTLPSYAIPPFVNVVGVHDNSNQQGLIQWNMKMVV